MLFILNFQILQSMFIRFYLLLIFFYIAVNVFGQLDPGARQISLAQSDVAQSNDVFSVFTNPAGLAQYNWREFGVYYSPSPFGLSELANGFAAYSEPFSFGTVGAGFSIYGFDLYKETKITLSFSKNVTENIFIGLTTLYHNLKIERYGSSSTFVINIGGLAYITPDFRTGFSIKNITHSSIGDEKNQIPMIFDFGVSYDIMDEFTLNTALQKELDFPVSIKFGIEYLIIKYLSLRLGFQNEPNTFASGVGINYSLFQLDYAVFSHQELGLTHQAGIRIHFTEFDSRKYAIKQYLKLK